MKLDAAAVRALNLLPSPLDGGNKTMSVAGLLNKCRTAQVCLLNRLFVRLFGCLCLCMSFVCVRVCMCACERGRAYIYATKTCCCKLLCQSVPLSPLLYMPCSMLLYHAYMFILAYVCTHAHTQATTQASTQALRALCGHLFPVQNRLTCAHSHALRHTGLAPASAVGQAAAHGHRPHQGAARRCRGLC